MKTDVEAECTAVCFTRRTQGIAELRVEAPTEPASKAVSESVLSCLGRWRQRELDAKYSKCTH